MRESERWQEGAVCVKRWTELHNLIASAAASTEAGRDNLPMSEIKGEKPKASFYQLAPAPCMMGAKETAITRYKNQTNSFYSHVKLLQQFLL